MSLREALEAKARRTAKLPILVGDLEAASAEVATFRAALNVQQGADSGKKESAQQKKLRADLAEAQRRQAECVVEVELQSLPADEWEALVGGLEADESGDVDLTQIHAVALAASCIDPELQDAEWWAVQLKGPHWSQGDRAAISQILMTLNWFTPRGVPGKG